MDRFRAAFTVLFATFAVIRAYYRIKARGNTLRKVQEKWLVPAEVLLGLPFMLGGLLYIFHPQPLESTSVAIGAAWRWAGAGIFAASLILLTWAHADLGKNFSAELRIRTDHELVTGGLYRHVRHPMYTFFFFLVIGMGLLSANWLIGTGGVCAFIVIVSLRLHKEEEMMATRFGERYRQYAAVTGRFLPRLRKRSMQDLGRAAF